MKKNIAVIQSVYREDAPARFERAVISVFEQDCGFSGINCYLFIDGHLGEGLQAVIDKYRDRFYKIISNETNIGLAAGLNRLIDSLEDEAYVFRMDSDDESLPGRFEKQLEFMEKKPETGICGTSLIEVSEDGGKRKRRDYFEDNGEIVGKMYKGTAVGHPTVCFRRCALDALKGYDENSGQNEDIEMWFRAAALGLKFHNIREPLYHHTISKGFYSRRSVKKAFKEFGFYWNGCNRLYGFGWRNIFPLLRLISRLMPGWVIKFLYGSSVRDYLFRVKKRSKRNPPPL
jgi:glycosyltransferase involved in cell wall biosynthesis